MSSAVLSYPFPRNFCKIFSNINPAAKIGPNLSYNINNVSKRLDFSSSYFKWNGSMVRRGNTNTAVACGGADAERGGLEAVLKLYEAIKNKNMNEISDMIAEECFCVSNFLSALQHFYGKKEVLDFFSCLIRNLGNNLQFVVQQTVDDGMVVGVSWKLEWSKTPLHLGKGFSLYTCHVYQGKVMIKNVEILLEPIVDLETLRLRVVSSAIAAMEKLDLQTMLKKKTRKGIIFVFILILLQALILLLFKTMI